MYLSWDDVSNIKSIIKPWFEPIATILKTLQIPQYCTTRRSNRKQFLDTFSESYKLKPSSDRQNTQQHCLPLYWTSTLALVPSINSKCQTAFKILFDHLKTTSACKTKKLNQQNRQIESRFSPCTILNNHQRFIQRPETLRH